MGCVLRIRTLGFRIEGKDEPTFAKCEKSNENFLNFCKAVVIIERECSGAYTYMH